MEAYEGEERRRAERFNLVTNCPVIFEYHRRAYDAMMSDLSELGAGMRLNGTPEEFFLARNEEIAYAVKTPYGTSQFRAHTQWARKTEEGYEWGVEFSQLSKDDKDPLRCLIDSPF
jgi:hypothetical protein